MAKIHRCRQALLVAHWVVFVAIVGGCAAGAGFTDPYAGAEKSSVAFKVAVAEGLPKDSPEANAALSADALVTLNQVATELKYFSAVINEPAGASKADIVLDVNHYKYGTKDVTVISGYQSGLALCVVPTRDGQHKALQYKSASVDASDHDMSSKVGWSQLPTVKASDGDIFEQQIKAALMHLRAEGMLNAAP